MGFVVFVFTSINVSTFILTLFSDLIKQNPSLKILLQRNIFHFIIKKKKKKERKNVKIRYAVIEHARSRKVAILYDVNLCQ